MARVARLAGAILVVGDDRYFLVGNPKRPVDWAAAGLAAPPAPIDATAAPVTALAARAPVALAPPVLDYPGDAAAVARRLADQLLIARNGAVSDRLWRLVTGADPDTDEAPARVDARWLAELPDGVWAVVRDAVLRCT